MKLVGSSQNKGVRGGLIAVNGDSLNRFLPGNSLSQLRALPVEWVGPVQNGDRERWLEILEETDPEIIIAGWGTPLIPEKWIHDGHRLRYVCNLTGGVRSVVPRKLVEDGLLVTNWGETVSHTVAEGGLHLILSTLRSQTEATLDLHIEGKWAETRHRTLTLFEKRVGLHGFGRIAQELSKLLKPFYCQVSAYSPSVPDSLMNHYNVHRETSLARLFSNNDIIVELAALTEKSEGMVTERMLRSIPPNGAFINIGRGAVVNEQGLMKVAAEGQLKMGLDVFHQEPLPVDNPLRGLKNVVLTPHSAGPTSDCYHWCGQHALKNLHQYLKGEELESVINLGRYDSMT